MMRYYHTSIMPDEVMDALQVKRDGLYFDGTLGGGGHSLRILQAGGKILATDLDGDAIEYATELFDSHGFHGRYTLIRENFKEFSNICKNFGIEKIDGALLDLGVSSHQFDEPERGFSYRFDAPLDMRMDVRQDLSAYDIINEYKPSELLRILYEYGEESFAKRIVSNIVKARGESPIRTTGELVKIIENSVPHRKGGHPAKQTFQALRIEVNGELNGLGEALEDIVHGLKAGARACVITFHSLEDRIIKRKMKTLATDCLCDKSIPICVCGHKAEVKLIKTNLKATKEEMEINTRSKSASLRVVEKI